MKNKFFRALGLYDKYMSTIGLAIILVLVFYQIIARYMLGSSLRWSEEVSRFILLYLVFLGVGAGLKVNKHVGVEAFIALLPAKIKFAAIILSNILTLLIFAVFAYYSGRTAYGIFKSGQVSPAAEIPMFLAYGTLPLGFLVAIIRQLEKISGIPGGRKNKTVPVDRP